MNSLSWQKVPLGNICDIVAGGTPSRKNSKYFGGEIPWVKISDMLQGTITFTDETITKEGLENSAAKILPAGTLLISIFATIGRTAILGLDAATNQAIVGVLPKKDIKINQKFLRYSLDNSILELTKEARGVAQININGKILKSLEIPLPPLPEQERIVRLLDEAEALRTQRAQANERMEDFVPALFDEMFGDSNKTKHNRNILPLQNVALKITDGTHLPPKFTQKGIPFLFVSNMVNGYIDFNTKKYISEEDFELLAKRVKPVPGDILYSTVGSYGVATLVETDKKFQFQRHIGYIKPNPKMLISEFLCTQLNTPFVKQQVDQRVRGVAQKTLNLAELNKVNVIVPPLALQQEFAERVKEAREIQSAQGRSTERVEALYQSMLDRAFKGEL